MHFPFASRAASALFAGLMGSLLVGATCASAAPADDVRVADAIHQSGAAINVAALQKYRVLKIDSKVGVAGLPGTQQSWQEIGGRRFAEVVNAAPFIAGDGYDGRDVWNSDGSGLVWIDAGVADRAQEIAEAYLADYALWSPNRGGARVSWGGVKHDGGNSFDVLDVQAPHAEVPFELWIDRATHLPMRFVLTIGTTTSSVTYSDYRSFDGANIAYGTHVDSGDGNTSDSTVTRVVADPSDGSERLRKPLTRPHDYSIDGGGMQTSVPIELAENHVYLSVMLNGEGPYRFIYDTGGQNLLDTGVAKRLAGATKGTLAEGGVGSSAESTSFATVQKLQIGNAVLRNQFFNVAPVREGFGVTAGRRVDGVIGFEVLSRFVTTFDYANRRVILALPGAPAARVGDDVPFVLNAKVPEFACTIDSIASRCTLDTGARESVVLEGPFLAQNPRVIPPGLTGIGVNGFGFGGPAMGRLGRLKELGFGSFALDDLVGGFTTQTAGAFAQPFVAANVGGGVWKRFSLTLNYQKLVMELVANASYGERDTYERAGMFLIQSKGKCTIIGVRPGTPAAKAGLLKGDVIDTVDGASASTMSLQAIRDVFLRPAGTSVRLGVLEKGGQSRQVTVVLRDFV